MTLKTYNKLVRDRIPEIIKADGKDFDTHIASKEEYTEMLEKKLNEEVNEYLEDKNIKELADLMEVIFALGENLGFSEYDLINIRNERNEKRGGFKKGIILEKVYE